MKVNINNENILFTKLNKTTPTRYEDMYYVCIYCNRAYKGFPPDWIILCDECKKKLNWNK